jgi:hypothetical protein
MERRDFESILNQWGILDESERWSLQTQFLYEYPEYYETRDFVRFIEKRYGKRESLTRTKQSSRRA